MRRIICLNVLAFFLLVSAPWAHSAARSCEIYLSAADSAQLDAAAPDYRKLNEEWIEKLPLSEGLRNKIKGNLFMLPYLLVTAMGDLSTDEISVIEGEFLRLQKSAGLELVHQEVSELALWFRSLRSDPKKMQAIYATTRFRKLLEVGEGISYSGVSISGLTDPIAKKTSRWRQLLAFPKTIAKLKQLIDEAFVPSTLDTNLFAFRGFHDANGYRPWGQRPWEPVKTPQIDGGLIHDFDIDEMVGIMIYAMEIEDGIVDYSFASGQGLRYLLPLVGRFMGKTEEEARKFLKQRQLEGKLNAKWCQSPWCKEEDRHGNMWRSLAQLITGVKPSQDNPNQGYIPMNDEVGAQEHLLSRQSTEWSATAAYLTLAAHSEGELEKAIKNIARDEIKHLTILSSAQTYLFGYRPWARIGNLVALSIREFFKHKERRTTGKSASSNPITFAEILVGHILIERKMQQFLKTLPLATLKEFFEKESQLPQFEAEALTEEQRAQVQRTERNGTLIREGLVRWKPKDMVEFMRQSVFEEINLPLINQLIAERFAGFKGCEQYESPESAAMRERIKEADLSGLKMEVWRPFTPNTDRLRLALQNRLRRYQILNNRLELERIAAAEKPAS